MASLLKQYGWYEWIVHSNFSFLIGGSYPDEYINTAITNKYSGMAITDYDGVYGAVRAWLAQKKHKDKLKLFYGAEIHLDQDHNQPLIYQNTLVLIATSYKGYINLCKILTLCHKNGKLNAHISVKDLLKSDVSDLITIHPMRGPFRRSGLQNISYYKNIKDHFKNTYFAIGKFYNNNDDYWITPIMGLAKKIGVKCILSHDVYFASSKQKHICDLLQAIRLNKTLDEIPDHLFINSKRCFHNLLQIEKTYESWPCFKDALITSREIADSCEFDLLELKYKYPKEMIPEGFSSQEYLEYLVQKEVKNIYGPSPPLHIIDLLQHELQLVETLNFADYFLTVWDIVRWARNQDILCQGRGSAANSAICFVLGITSIDPNQFDLLFERFISVERGDPPDIDVDFEHERREEVIQYIYNRYGRDRAAMVSNIITFKTKGAMRSVGKALGFPGNIIDEASKLYGHYHDHNHMDIKSIINLLQKKHLTANPLLPWGLWIELAQDLRGFPRHLGIHSGGFIIGDRSINQLVPQEPATKENRTVIQWNKDDVEALGFFKIDILALGMLTALHKAFKLLKYHYGKNINLTSIPKDDPDTYGLMQKADTIGTFQIESPSQISMLPKLRPKCFYDLVIQISIIRPAPIKAGLINPYLRRREGIEKIEYGHPALEPILKRTLGVPIFQEQIMRISMAVGDFTSGQADQLRRYMGAWQIKSGPSSNPWIKKLAAGMRRRGISEKFIKNLTACFRGFSEYGFPESHAASFAKIAYASSYIKAHYPEIFYLSLINSQPMGFYSVSELIEDAQKRGVIVLPICIKNSYYYSTLELPDKGTRFQIRLGFHLIPGFSLKIAKKLIKTRSINKGGKHFFRSLELSKYDLGLLANAGALSIFGLNKNQAIWLAEASPFSSLLEERGILDFL